MDKGKRVVIEEDEDEEPIFIEQPEEPNDHTVSMCLLGKLWTSRSYNTFGLIETMRKLWSPSKGVTCREMGNNMISFQFKSKGDMQRVLAMEPWHFNKHVLVLKRITDAAQPSEIEFNSTPFWMRLYDLPFNGRTESTIQQIGGRFGEVLEVDKETMIGVGRSIRIKIQVRLDKPLKKGTKIRIGKSEPRWIPTTYERLPSFCYWCGMLGHSHKDCTQLMENEENGERLAESEMPYGDWMRASPMKLYKEPSSREGTNRAARDDLRRSLFPSNVGHRDGKQNPEVETNLQENNSKVEQQVDELLTSMQRVEVSGKMVTKMGEISRIPKVIISSDINTTAQKSAPKAKPIPSAVYNTIPSAAYNTMHPTTETTTSFNTHTHTIQAITHPENTPNHTDQPTSPIPLVPLADLIKMVNNQTTSRPIPSSEKPPVTMKTQPTSVNQKVPNQSKKNEPRYSKGLNLNAEIDILTKKPVTMRKSDIGSGATHKPSKTWKRHQSEYVRRK